MGVSTDAEKIMTVAVPYKSMGYFWRIWSGSADFHRLHIPIPSSRAGQNLFDEEA